MAKRTFKAGATSQSIDVFIQDSSSTTGAGLSGLAYNTSNLKAYYRAGATGTATAITLATQTVGGAYSSGGFVEIDATNMKGVYRLDLPNAVLTSSPYSTIYIYGATNVAPCVAEVEIVAYDPYDAVRLGLTALPNVASGSAGAIVTAGTGTAQISTSSGQVILQTGTGTGQLDFTSGVVKANAVQLLGTAWLTPGTAGTPDVNTKLAGGTAWGSGAITAAAIAADAITDAKVASDVTIASVTGAVGSVTGAVGSVTGNVGGNVTGSVGSVVGAVGSVTARVTANTDQLAGQTVTAAAGVTFPTSVASPTNITAGTITTVTNLTNAATAGDFTSTMKTSIGTAVAASAVASVTGAVGSVTGNVGGNVTGSVGSLATQAKADVNAEVVDALATDTYAEPGQGTPAATLSLSAKIGYLFKAWRNKSTQTSTAYNLYNDDAATVDQKATTSDDGTTFSRGEVATGP